MKNIQLPELDIPFAFSGRSLLSVKMLAKLALNLEWSWNPAAKNIWESLDKELWEKTHNPWAILQSMPLNVLKDKITEKDFLSNVKKITRQAIKGNLTTHWFEKEYGKSSLDCVAYFSMEYMLSESLPIYVGGLGNVAGDQLKSANDLGVPIVAVGLLYQKGYFRQELDKNGRQIVLNPSNDSSQLPITAVRKQNGEWLRIKIKFPIEDLWIKVWQVQVGKLRLFLLDANDLANSPFRRGITSEIYGGDTELRIQQEIVLGIGGYRVLRELGIQPQVCHLNEGHSAFLILERARYFMQDKKCSFEEALYATKVGNLFTTHTAVAAGFDHFSHDLLNLYLGDYIKDDLNTELSFIENLGKISLESNESFSMANLAIHGSGHVNAVSQLHGLVSQSLFSPMFPRFPLNEIPIDYVTNGVHMPTWASDAANTIWSEIAGDNIWNGLHSASDKKIIEKEISYSLIWNTRKEQKKALIDIIRKKASQELYLMDMDKSNPEFMDNLFDPNVLTIGFARRFVPYKRNDLLLHDEQRLVNLLTNYENPVQIVIAGKAPPFDQGGNDMIAHWIDFIRKHELHSKIIFLSDYDIQLAQYMVRGVDIWLNTPRRPWEACGTSGMKVLVNGGLNLSVLDGWWVEAYNPNVGWAIGDGKEHDNDYITDNADAEQLYSSLEQQIIPEYYERNKKGIPEKWVEKIRQSLIQLTPVFSADRAVREYTEKHYLALADLYATRSQKSVADIQKDIALIKLMQQKWHTITFQDFIAENQEEQYHYKVTVNADEIPLPYITVQAFADEVNNLPKEIVTLKRVQPKSKKQTPYYEATFKTDRPLQDFTLRAIPDYSQIASVLELPLITWQR
ncbi:MAG: DUF3417 domain-containing protein [Pseudopedobacter saltans]|uniref:DUF3417 domain-containing protein n=1 Tax=Pseudopedobacter saltans TaxID=151895 RepID=A0A2W5EZ13_9SPHI|nr:MAG: DUF3417 domain-containing protein [Pseudopedobacter saltans]